VLLLLLHVHARLLLLLLRAGARPQRHRRMVWRGRQQRLPVQLPLRRRRAHRLLPLLRRKLLHARLHVLPLLLRGRGRVAGRGPNHLPHHAGRRGRVAGRRLRRHAAVNRAGAARLLGMRLRRLGRHVGKVGWPRGQASRQVLSGLALRPARAARLPHARRRRLHIRVQPHGRALRVLCMLRRLCRSQCRL
jgi:hypothetical protein